LYHISSNADLSTHAIQTQRSILSEALALSILDLIIFCSSASFLINEFLNSLEASKSVIFILSQWKYIEKSFVVIHLTISESHEFFANAQIKSSILLDTYQNLVSLFLSRSNIEALLSHTFFIEANTDRLRSAIWLI
jgi:hypothetical protein